jgi:O-antigen ligase
VLTLYFTAGLPFAYWRGGSFYAWQHYWVRTMLVCLMAMALTATYKEAKALLNAIALASVTAAVLGLFFKGAQTVEGRLVLAGGRFGNPNDFALVLIIGLPLIWRMYHDSRSTALPRRGLLLLAMLATLVCFFRTGSRAGLYTAVVMILTILPRAPLAAKLRIVASVAVLTVLFATVLPSNLRDRYLTFDTADRASATSDAERVVLGSAVGSTRARETLLRESLLITLRRPVFGIGMGNFAAYVAETDTDPEIRDVAWLGTHNTYTQLSCEAGIPSALIFIFILVLSWRSLTRLIRATRDDLRPLARDIHITAHAMQVCLGCLASFLMFFHVAYDLLPHLLVAVCLVVSRTGEAALAGLEPAPRQEPAAAIKGAAAGRWPAVAS